MARRIKIILIILGIGLFPFLVYLNFSSFAETTNRILEILNPKELKNFFEVYNESSNTIYQESITEIQEAVDNFIGSVNETFSKPIEEILLDILLNILDFGFNIILYVFNYGLTAFLALYIFLNETFNGTQKKVKTSFPAFIFIKINHFISFIIKMLKKGLKIALGWLYKQRRKLALIILYIALANGLIYRIITEFIIFVITYIIKMIDLEAYKVILSMVQTLFTIVYPKLKHIPTWAIYPILAILLFITAVARANYKLKKNHERLKKFASEDLTQTTFINGPPGTGKTLLNVSLTLASEENFIEELEKKILDYEMNHKYLNFANIRKNPQLYPEHDEYSYMYYLLKKRGSFITSNFSIYSPYFNEYSKIFDFDYLRVNKKTDVYPLEEYIVISLSEFDKEYNSHDDKKLVGEDGAATFFSTVSHNLKRHTKIFVDYQLKDQVPLRIRGNAEYFLTIKKRDKKYPILLMLYYLPFKLALKIVSSLLKKYELKKNKTSKGSMRKTVAKYKRNDITLPYAILRRIATPLKRICRWFDSFYYFKMSTILSQEGEEKGLKRKLGINIRDLSHNNQNLYDSTFLSFAYEQKKNVEFKNLDRFTKLAPPKNELDKCHSKFYDKINQ